MIEWFLLGILFWVATAGGGMALLWRLTRDSRRRRLWLILGGMILLPPSWNIGHPTIFAPAWVGVAMGLIYNPGAVFELKNIVPFVQYFGAGAAVTAVGIYVIGRIRKHAGSAGSESETDRKSPTDIQGGNR